MITRKEVFSILFWVFLIVTIILILWKILGDSPTDLSIMISIMIMLLFKMWAVSDDLIEFKHEVRMSFHKVKVDISDIKKDFINLKLKERVK